LGADARVVLPYGDSAFLVELPDLEAVLEYYRGLSAGGTPEGVVDVVPAARTVLVTFRPEAVPASSIRTWLEEARPAQAAPGSGRDVRIEVSYGGQDLAEVAAILGISEAEVVRLHTGSVWTAAFSGFAPGFAYLVTDHEKLRVPRRATPRTIVPAGSVGLAGEFSGIYPRSSPGGWQLIGTTSATLWDAVQPEPALVRPGDRVRFTEA
jgi:KipI family sensor histidine kinase inhibitor